MCRKEMSKMTSTKKKPNKNLYFFVKKYDTEICIEYRPPFRPCRVGDGVKCRFISIASSPAPMTRH